MTSGIEPIKKQTDTVYQSGSLNMEQITGIEPASSAWEADILPLNYTCILLAHSLGIEPRAIASEATILSIKLRVHL